ncbi:MAG: 2-C-methyl-D-erythritol 2,4-cyclodiphosphate synthase, partial [Gammaproteobacteria bacterium]|nr:2-C-methyl-D-erythritol 2,4-cyclodiphosphate synthase [Gammaproteobacteria bacterium]
MGNGYTTHRFRTGRPPHAGRRADSVTQGVIASFGRRCRIHALCDALFGAAALGDIGRHFPDSNPSIATRTAASLWPRDGAGHRAGLGAGECRHHAGGPGAAHRAASRQHARRARRRPARGAGSDQRQGRPP